MSRCSDLIELYKLETLEVNKPRGTEYTKLMSWFKKNKIKPSIKSDSSGTTYFYKFMLGRYPANIIFDFSDIHKDWHLSFARYSTEDVELKDGMVFPYDIVDAKPFTYIQLVRAMNVLKIM